MSESFIKKIVSVVELKQLSEDFKILYKEDNEAYQHACNLSHDIDLITKSLSHESLLIWNIHVWAHFNGEKWDSIFIGVIRKSEKFNAKMMEEYLWLSKNSRTGMRLYNAAVKYAKQQNVEYISMSVIENHPLSNKVKNFYNKTGFQKDSETYIKKL